MIEYAVIGAGPVGLYVACLLADAGRDVVVLERDADDDDVEPRVPSTRRSRAIGIHPPALEALAVAGVADELIARGHRIETARLMLGADHVGSLHLSGCPGPYRFVLTVPQHVTEAVLRRRFATMLPDALRAAHAVVDVTRTPPNVEVTLDDGRCLQAGFVVGCDGRSSRVRDSLGVPVVGGSLDHHYLMADVKDDGSFDGDAMVCLAAEGVVESFPLPGERRRWVARVRERPSGETAANLADIVKRRTGMIVDIGEASVAAFTAERRFARTLAGHGWALAGDAAHVISPIGGQGMNLGLLGGLDLVRALTGAYGVGGSSTLDDRLASYDRRQRTKARAAARRAWLNMALGGGQLPHGVRRAALRTVLAPVLRERFARYFTMRGL